MWNGASWVLPNVKVWNGSAWVFPYIRMTISDGVIEDYTIKLSNHSLSVSDSQVENPCVATAKFTLCSNGVAQGTTTSTSDGTVNTNYSGEWLNGATATDFSAYVTVTGSALRSGTTGSWVSLGSSDVYWSIVCNAISTPSSVSKYSILNIKIAKSSDTSNILATANVYLDASAVNVFSGGGGGGGGVIP